MASKKPDNGGGTLNRLAGRGEEAVTKLVEELSKNPRVTDALSRVMDAKTRIDQSARGAVAQAGLAAADELKDLRKQVEKGGWHDVKTEDGAISLYLGKVAFLRIDSGEHRVGFSLTSPS